MAELLRLTLTAVQDRRPVVCLVRFEHEPKASHRRTRNPDGPASGVGVRLDVEDGGRWVRAEIAATEQWAIVVRPV